MSDPGENVEAAVRPGVAPGGLHTAETPVPAPATGKPRGQFADVWAELRRKPMFWISAFLILVFLVMAAFPSLFTSIDPDQGSLRDNLQGPSKDAWFGRDIQGRDIYARTIYGAQASIVVSVIATLGTVLIGGFIGVVSGYIGGWVDGLLSRIADVFFGLPFLLGALLILFTFNPPGSAPSKLKVEALVAVSLMVLSWPVSMRIMRSAVLSVKEADYIVAARALGASPFRIVLRHVIPNCLASMLVYSTILIGSFIGAEATLSYLGVGLKSPAMSWGIMINEAQQFLRDVPGWLFFPAAFLVTAVLAFVMLGESIREALDPKLR
ncbi:peptide ABC transporter permease [Pilimelia terevasa]|uniref:Peptide ABC transporter permease n=1 Tax=Pilimelia terevasa TaxID=53372 RepID=A0A8J3BGZ9_9ACTN|nr:ABC transporter permease [Pilimelia terevasa]GGK14313.1 peptide ABC transporter permease [Pilimelia terevasa]